MDLKESDWKTFKAHVPEWRERYLSEKNIEARSILEDASRSRTEAFWDALQFLKSESKILHRCFDNYSRSKVFLSLIQMYTYGIISESDLDAFSKDLRDRITGIVKE